MKLIKIRRRKIISKNDFEKIKEKAKELGEMLKQYTIKIDDNRIRISTDRKQFDILPSLLRSIEGKQVPLLSIDKIYKESSSELCMIKRRVLYQHIVLTDNSDDDHVIRAFLLLMREILGNKMDIIVSPHNHELYQWAESQDIVEELGYDDINPYKPLTSRRHAYA